MCLIAPLGRLWVKGAWLLSPVSWGKKLGPARAGHINYNFYALLKDILQSYAFVEYKAVNLNLAQAYNDVVGNGQNCSLQQKNMFHKNRQKKAPESYVCFQGPFFVVYKSVGTQRLFQQACL